jgi:hypothetical protein
VPGSNGAVRRCLAVATAALTIAVILAGCGTDPGSAGSAQSSPTGSRASGPTEAETFARQLIAHIMLPPGSHPVRLTRVPLPLNDPWAGPAGSAAQGSIDLGQFDTTSLSPAASEAFLLTHALRGADAVGSGQENGPAGIVARDLYFHLGSLPRGIADAEVVLLMVPREAASTLIASYVHVAWSPSRKAAEYLNEADFGVMSVHVVFLNPTPHSVTKTFRSPADISELTRLLNGLSAEPDVVHTCPAEVASYQITFEPRSARQARVVITALGCYGVSVATSGIPQPALLDPRNAVVAAASRLLGVRGKPPL